MCLYVYIFLGEIKDYITMCTCDQHLIANTEVFLKANVIINMYILYSLTGRGKFHVSLI